MNYSKLFAITALAAIALLAFGCTSGKKEPVTITVLGENSSNVQAMAALKGLYEAKENVRIDFKPNTFEDAFNKANQDFANKTGLYDIVLQYNFSLSSFVRNNFVYTLDELYKEIPDSLKVFESDIFPNAWREVGYYYKDPSNPSAGDVRIGYPFAANTMLLVYNKEMFESNSEKDLYRKKNKEELEVPTDWDHFRTVAEFFSKADKTTGTKTFGVCLQGAAGGWLYYEYCTFLFGIGGSVMMKEAGWEGTASTPINLDSPIAVQATNYYKGLKSYNAGNFTTIDANEQVRILKEGKVAMAFVWSDYLFGLVYDADGKIDDRFGFAPLPGNKSPLAGGCFYINKQSKHPAEALKYVINLMQKKNQVELTKKGLCSPLRSTYDDPEIHAIPYAAALRSSLERGVYMFEAGPESDLVSQTITNYLQQFWEDKLLAEQALSKAKADIVKGRDEIYANVK